MAITSVSEKLEGRATQEDERGRRHTRVFVCVTGAISDGPQAFHSSSTALQTWNTANPSNKIPVIGELHPDDAFCRCRSVTPNQQDGGKVYHVICEYDTNSRFTGFTFNSTGDSITYNHDNPLQRQWEYSFGTVKEQVPLERAKRIVNLLGVELIGELDEPVTNSAGQPFDPPAITTRNIMEMRISRYIANDAHDPVSDNAFIDCINYDAWTMAPGIVWPKRTAKVEDIQTRSEHVSGYWYWHKTTVIRFKWDTWVRHLLDQGMGWVDVDPNDASRKRYHVAKDEEGYAAAEPVLLNGSGEILPRSVPAVDPVYRTYLANRTIDFTALGLNVS
jgi:hypothetical protein